MQETANCECVLSVLCADTQPSLTFLLLCYLAIVLKIFAFISEEKRTVSGVGAVLSKVCTARLDCITDMQLSEGGFSPVSGPRVPDYVV